MADKSELTTKINVDCSEAITGLKAIQREAKEATKALRELEDAGRGFVLDSKGLHVAKGSISIERPDGHSYITDSSHHKVSLAARYVVIDFGEPTGEDIEIGVRGHNKINRVFLTDELN